jgi:hypothetical protein
MALAVRESLLSDETFAAFRLQLLNGRLLWRDIDACGRPAYGVCNRGQAARPDKET